MKILSIGGTLTYQSKDIDTIDFDAIDTIDIDKYDYLVIHGGDGAIRRTVATLQGKISLPPIIINPTGSFNIIAKYYRIKDPNSIVANLFASHSPTTRIHKTYTLNDNLFLFSAGNMFDAQHIAIAESLRFGWLKNGWLKYALSFIFLLPLHLTLLPWFLWSKKHFFIFTPLANMGNMGNIYGNPSSMTIDMPSEYNLLELDGDILIIADKKAVIKEALEIKIVIDG